MSRIGLLAAFILFISGCASHSALTVQPYNQLSIDVPENLFSSVKVREGELLFLRDNQVVGFIKSDVIPSTVRSDSAADTSRILFESAAEGSRNPFWIDRIPEAPVFGVVQNGFLTIFIVPNDAEHILVTFQGPEEHSRALRINGRRIFE